MSYKIKLESSLNVIPMIYAYTTPGVIYHNGWTKIGYTERDVDKRIAEQTQTANIFAKKEWQGLAYFSDGKTRFTDKEFHAYLSKKGIERKEPQKDDEGCPEWFKISGDSSYSMFGEFKRNQGILNIVETIPYNLRQEQKQAVQEAKNYFTNNEKPEFLWNAKPRFGKTLSTYDLCKKLNAVKILIVTNRPAIANSWYEDYVKFLGTSSGYYFVSNTDTLKGKKYVITREKYISLLDSPNHKGCIEFISLQDLKGSLYFGGNHDKLREVSELKWDLLVIDEAHEGVDTYKTDVAFDHIKRRYTLHLSGTPFKAIASEKFKDKAIFNWTYADEQRKKREWDNKSESENPYADLPKLNLYTYKMSDVVQGKAEAGCSFNGDQYQYYWDLNEFFKTNNQGEFIHDSDVDKFLDELTVNEKFPFSTKELRNEIKHSLWILKYISSAKALAKKLKNHPVFKDEYEIVLAAGDGKFEDDEGNSNDINSLNENITKSYDKVVHAIKNYEKTITISVGQLTTGITIPQWTAVLMLSNMKSPTLYMQAAFRAQNPCLFECGKNKLRKQNAYVFDFDPARTLDIFEEFANDLISKTSNHKGDTSERKNNVKELLNFFPIYGEDKNGEMITLDAEKVLSIPRTIHAKEVVKSGFMSNFLFQNIGNVFNAPNEVLEIIKKFDATKEPIIDNDAKEKLNIDENGDVNIGENKVIGIAQDVFGDKLYSDIEEELKTSIEKCNKSFNTNSKDQTLDKLLDNFHSTVTKRLIDAAKNNYGKDMLKSVKTNLIREINASAETKIKKEYADCQIKLKKLEADKIKAVKKAEKDGNSKAIKEIEKEYKEDIKIIEKEFLENVSYKVNETIDEAGKSIVRAVETDKSERKKGVIMNDIRDRLRGFTRTIPSFLMAYGTEKTTLENFEKNIPENVFKEVTSITIDEFKKLRDGFDYTDEQNNVKHYNGFIDPIVFNDSVKEFFSVKRNLSNYFDEKAKEDIFDYIPPQKTNQIYTPRKVVVEMVDNLENENPGCFDNPDLTFIDFYMKSGLYIAEIVKRLYRSKALKRLYPDRINRLNHIFEHQVYGLAPTEIIYRIAISYLLGFDETIRIKKNNFKCFDSYPYSKNGTLEKEINKLFK